MFLLDNEGHRLLAKYYQPNQHALSDPKATLINGVQPQPAPFKTLKEQRSFEQAVFDKTKKAGSAHLLPCLYLMRAGS